MCLWTKLQTIFRASLETPTLIVLQNGILLHLTPLQFNGECKQNISQYLSLLMFHSTACKPFFAGIVYNMKPAVSTGLSDDDGVGSGMDEVFTK